MTLWRPTRRELITTAPLFLGASVLHNPLFAASREPLFRFFVIGDWGRNGRQNQREVGTRMGIVADQLKPSFIVSTGDNFYDLGVHSTTDLRWETSFEDIYTSDGLRSAPWYIALGNHDYGGRVQAQIDRTGRDPHNRWKLPQRWYSVPGEQNSNRYPDVDLFFIDTVAWRGKESFPLKYLGTKISHKERQAQAAWLSRALRKSTARYKLVFGHHGIFQISQHGGARDMPELHDIMHEHGVAAYIHGHDHCMYHITHRGMHHICSGAGSQIRSGYKGGKQSGCVIPGLCSDAAEMVSDYPKWHSFLFDAKKLPSSWHHDYHLEGGFAAFEVYSDYIQFSFIDQFGKSRHTAIIPPRLTQAPAPTTENS